MKILAGIALIVGLPLFFVPGPGEAQEDLGVYFALLIKPVCDEYIPGFEASTSDGYLSWRELNEVAIASHEKNRGFTQQSEQIVNSVRERGELDHETIVQCRWLESTFGALSRPVDPSMKTPEGTWSTLRYGLENGDRESVLKCVTASAADVMQQVLDGATDEQLRQLAGSLGKIVSTNVYGEIAEAAVVTHEGKGSSVLFHRNINEEWVITSL